jgi:cobalt/nickel transport system permease protein
LFEVALGPVTLGPSVASLMSGLVFLSRVGVSVSLAVLLVLTTPWADLLKSLHAMHTPQVFVLLLSMTYRYIFLFLHAVNGLFEARKSRMVAPTSGNEARRWIGNSMGALMNRSFKMSNDVYVAMLARGFSGQVRSYSQFRMATADWLALGLAVAVAIGAVAVERLAG